MTASEPRQNRKVAALSSVCHVPQVIRVAVGPLSVVESTPDPLTAPSTPTDPS